MKIAALELPHRFGDPAGQLARVDRLLGKVGGAQLALLPECALTGYLSETGDPDLRRFAEPLEGPTSRALAGLARKWGLALAGPLIEALRAAQRRDRADLTAALSHSVQFTTENDARHRCAAVLGEAARRLDIVDALPADAAAHLRSARINAIIGTSRMHRAVSKSIAILETAGIDFALLKGAARIHDRDSDAAYHPSDDIDILVRGIDVDAAVTVFLVNGWSQRESAAEIQRFRREIHRALSMSSHLSTPTDWEALQVFFVPLATASTSAWQFDALGTALHLTLHAIGLTRLRDVALLARLLPTLTAENRLELRRIVARERRDPVRLAAPLALAAYIAGIPWPSDSRVNQYIRWALRREDLPGGMRIRSDAVETYFARPDAPWMALTRLVPWWSRGIQRYAVPGRIIARSASNLAAILYANMLPAAVPEQFKN